MCGSDLDRARVPAIAARVTAHGKTCTNRRWCYCTACSCRSRNKFGAVKDGRHFISHIVLSEALCSRSFNEGYLGISPKSGTADAEAELCKNASS